MVMSAVIADHRNSVNQSIINQVNISLLRHAFKKSTGMPVYYQKKILSIYFQFIIKDWSFRKSEKFIKSIKELVMTSVEPPLLTESAANDPSCISGMSSNRSTHISSIEAIGRVDMLFNMNDVAMEKAALSVFNRLMEALDPESIKKNSE